VGNSANRYQRIKFFGCFPAKSPIGTTLVMLGSWIERWPADPPKGRMKMSGNKFQHQLFAVFASLLMSSIAVGAAIAPAQVAASPIKVFTYA
jgi:hypothetical protein